jgi:hypothetical protein
MRRHKMLIRCYECNGAIGHICRKCCPSCAKLREVLDEVLEFLEDENWSAYDGFDLAKKIREIRTDE